MFSFACVAYELLTGKHPFDRRSSLQAREEGHLPPRAWNLTASQWLTLLSALAWTREQRPRDVEALVTALTPEPRAGVTTPEWTDRAGARTLPARSCRRPHAAATKLGLLRLHRLRARRDLHRKSAAGQSGVVEAQAPIDAPSHTSDLTPAPVGLMAAPVDATTSAAPLARAPLGRVGAGRGRIERRLGPEIGSGAGANAHAEAGVRARAERRQEREGATK